MNLRRLIVVAIFWYLAGCLAGTFGYFQYLGMAVLWAPITLPMYFIYPDIFFGSGGSVLVLLLLFVAGFVFAHGIKKKKHRLATCSIYAVTFSIGALGGLAVVMSQIL